MIGDRIKQLRLDISISQEDLARVLGKSRAAIASYEANNSLPDIETLQKLADFFEVSLDYLAGRSQLRSQFEAAFDLDFEENEVGKLTGEILDSMQETVKGAALEKNVELLKIVNRVYRSIIGVKISTWPEGKIIINDECNGVLMILNSISC
jgi:transcriptional regulator with XRE-family HTH domain